MLRFQLGAKCSLLMTGGDPVLGQRSLECDCKKKAWRSKCFLGDPCLRRKCLNLCWLAAPLECCSSRLQYLDEHSHTGLWDVQQASQRNPFWAAPAEIISMLKRGVNGPLGLICSYIEPEQHWLALHEMRTMGMEINAQIKF